jgi:hypothetical protein
LACLVYACGICSYAYAQNSVSIVVAQANVPGLSVAAGSQNPVGTIDVTGDAQNLNALQLTLAPVAETARIDTVTIGLGAAPLEDLDHPLGNDGLVDVVRVRLISDTNGNGIHDSDEPVLGIQEAEDFEDGEPATVDFTFSPPLIISPGLDTTWLVTIDINSDDRATDSALWRQTPWGRLGWIALSLPMLGALIYRDRLHLAPWRSMMLILCISCGLALWACDNDDDEAFVFVVNLPRNGLTYQKVRLGPETAISGATIRLTES